MTKQDPIPARLAALKTTSTPDLKQQWRDLFDSEPPPFNRRYLESRLAYRIQELAYGGLKPETVKRLEALGEQLDGGDRKKSRIRADLKPIVGTRLIREWQGVEHVVTVTADGFDWQGRPYKSLSAIARAITGTRWNGWVFFRQKNHRRAHDQTDRQEAALRRLHPEILRGRAGAGVQQLHAQREACEAYIASQRSEGWVLVRDQYDDGGISGGTLERPGLKRLLADVEDWLGGRGRRVQDRPPVALADGLFQAGRGV